ncbi:MAG TPA: protein kinase [Ktedonobacteraceae bacterium]|nr:protein kinase [Ktedonobacteraceae bacterium]
MSISESKGKPNQTAYKQLIGQGLQNGEYRIESQIGQGGMGQVFLARHVELDTLFALKQARADQPLPEEVVAELERMLYGPAPLNNPGAPPQRPIDNFPLSGGVLTDHFLREVLLLARLNHPAIPMLYDYFLEDGHWYLVMDYIPGKTLASYMHKSGSLEPLEAINYALQLCDVLEYLHQLQPPVIFRDLKPSNIILTPEHRLVLIDFGIARYFKEGHVNDTIELGSPGYAPPEQYQGAGQTDWRSDLYSLGVILHEMLCGKRPPSIGNELEPLHQLNPHLSSALSALVMIATRHAPQHRFQSAYTFYQALERVHTIEERRAYSQQVLAYDETTELLRYPDKIVTLTPKLEVIPHSQLRSSVSRKHVLTERIEIRRHLQRLHRQRAQEVPSYEQETQLDDSLNAIPPIQPSGLPSMPDLVPHSSITKLSKNKKNDVAKRRLGPGNLIALLVIVLLLVGILIFQGVNRNGGQVVQPTPTHAPPQHKPTPTPTAIVRLGSWQRLAALPAPNEDNSSLYVKVNGHPYVYMTGGFRNQGGTSRYDQNLYRYDITAKQWETISGSGFPGMVNNAMALTENNTIFFTSGYSTGTSSIDSLLYQYQPDTGYLQKIIPPAQMPLGFGGSMFADQQGHLYLSEGFMQPGGDPGNRAGTGWYRYDITSNSWHTLASLPEGLAYTILTKQDTNTLLMLGGAKDAAQSQPTNSIYRYDIQNDSWQLETNTLPGNLSAAASCQQGDSQVILGGYDSTSNAVMQTGWLFQLSTEHFQPLTDIPSGESMLGTAVCDQQGHVYFTQGGFDKYRPTTNFWELTLPKP